MPSINRADILSLTVREIEDLALQALPVPRGARRPKETLVDFVLENGTEELHLQLREAVTRKLAAREERIRLKRRRDAEQAFQRRRRPESYLSLPSIQQTQTCYRQFYDATGARHFAIKACAICAREMRVEADGVEEILLDALGDLERLKPSSPHAAQPLVNGCALEPSAIRREGNHKPDTESYQRGMRGTVSTYELSMDGLSSMLEGRLMPQPARILASVISVTFVGRGKLPKNWLRTTFRVRRNVVGDALRWLKENNTRYYGDISISEDRLRAIPEDEVPDELVTGMRQCSDEELAMQEGAGYVPEADDEEDDIATEISDADAPPDIIPMQVTGTVDTDLSKLSASKLMLWGLTNLWSSGREGGYAVRHGNRPSSDFPPLRTEADDNGENARNYFERAFPVLFPYGTGGIEGRQQWALRYHDRRFRLHETFPFVAFAIEQKRQALSSARVQMRQKAFAEQARILATIDTDTLAQACAEEAANTPITSSAVRTLKQLVHGAAGRVLGSDASRSKIRAQIWSTCLVHGPPSLWVTINPILAGADIDLDNFLASFGPTAEERTHVVARDPYAAAHFFHFMVDTILTTLYQVRVTPYTVKSEEGVLGKVSAYVGAVESQGRGTLHLHMLVWLANTPPADEIPRLFQQADFRNRVKTYIAANIRAYLPGLESAESTRAVPKEANIAYNRPINPYSEEHASDSKAFELKLARSQQVHTCKLRRCQFFDKSGKLVCKRRAPFEYAEDDFANADGRWGPKRLFQFVNAWNPAILLNVRCNNDIKLLTNGEETKNITFYVSSYASKKQGRNYNMSSIMASGFAFDAKHQRPEYTQDIRQRSRLLLFRLIHAVNREQELAAPMVISYLMGWNDTKTSHTYSPLYWSSFSAALRHAFPDLVKR
ncbi:hypothetical protein FKP32DRAFT_1615465 [Trametes sanguinea]|nr:hypothetical protein FKP32DRAFT_1615465 [Trametes sanguinea]